MVMIMILAVVYSVKDFEGQSFEDLGIETPHYSLMAGSGDSAGPEEGAGPGHLCSGPALCTSAALSPRSWGAAVLTEKGLVL